MERNVKQIELLGAHVGGTSASTAFLERPTPQRPLNVRIVDHTAGRAATLAENWRRAGHTAIATVADARAILLRSDVDVLGICTDDPTVQLQMLEQAHARFLIIGMLLAAPSAGGYGGSVLGFGASVPEDDGVTHTAVSRVFQEIVRLTQGTRVTSRRVSDPVINNMQVGPVREALYQRLSEDAHGFLASGRGLGRLYVSTLWPTLATYRLEVQQRQGRSRGAMKLEAERQARALGKDTPGESWATAFVDNTKSPWLLTVLPGGFGQTLTVELPESPAVQAGRVASQGRRMAAAQAAAAAAARTAAPPVIYATD